MLLKCAKKTHTKFEESWSAMQFCFCSENQNEEIEKRVHDFYEKKFKSNTYLKSKERWSLHDANDVYITDWSGLGA